MVNEPPMDMFTNNSASVAYFNGREGSSTKNFSANNMAQMVMAAGSVIKEPEVAVTTRRVNHHACKEPPNTLAMRQIISSNSLTTGRLDAMIMMTITNIGSTYVRLFR